MTTLHDVERRLDDVIRRFDACARRKRKMHMRRWDSDFVESEHPRAPDGKFGSGGSSGEPAKKLRVEPTRIESGPERDKAVNKFFGYPKGLDKEVHAKLNKEQEDKGLATLGSGEASALAAYLIDGYARLNGPLRRGFMVRKKGYLQEYKPNPKSAAEKNLSAAASALSDALSKLEDNDKPMVRLNALEGEDLEDFLGKYREGSVVSENQFTSATRGTGANLSSNLFTAGNANVRIKINKGGKLVPSVLEGDQNEQEVVFDRGTKFRVKSVKKLSEEGRTGNGRYKPPNMEIELELE
jgi:hypothetical protein